MSSVGYCFNICRSVDQKIANERRSSVCNPQSTENPSETGTLIFGRRFSLSHSTQPNTNHTSQNQNDLSSNQNGLSSNKNAP
ncbi:unnamed protein product [Rotaria sp. Silwood1]|nr:unnamed protein product [Rotaria sp. Silwood1]CAF3320468.1 unnamed protein product [Rotaria sp. Silwood1]CAF3336576.1 unnamed protein product [Rotaria sp. Silwood1]CAF3344264.1 unnamed protein product [Rotaria sp. Silwood1]CAF4631436.1 unnamed protein product [Rotaria sp. Silwood1]